jgi:hypothetical protein
LFSRFTAAGDWGFVMDLLNQITITAVLIVWGYNLRRIEGN